MSDYTAFIARKAQLGGEYGFDPIFLPDFLFGFQRALVTWALRRGRAAIFADTGLGKGPIALTWAANVAERTGKPVLIATPLAVSYQFQTEGEKFGIKVARAQDGRVPDGARIVVTNYERLSAFLPTDFAGCVCDESAILKSFDGTRRREITEFMRTLPYRLLASATPAPNDYTELGTSSEALGELGHMDMLARFFKNDQGTCDTKQKWHSFHGYERQKWRFRGHAEEPFWRWVCSWARAVRRPNDLGSEFTSENARYALPPLVEQLHIVQARTTRPGWLFDVPAVGLREEKEERRRTVGERCERVAELVDGTDQALVWCHLNVEGDLLARTIRDAVQVKGGDSDDEKEKRLLGFARGDIRVLVTKPKIGAWGLNLQKCGHVVTFPGHSFEQHYQGVRRCWRYGRVGPVVVDLVATDGEERVLANLQAKAAAADKMFDSLVRHVAAAAGIARGSSNRAHPTEVPAWLSPIK